MTTDSKPMVDVLLASTYYRIQKLGFKPTVSATGRNLMLADIPGNDVYKIVELLGQELCDNGVLSKDAVFGNIGYGYPSKVIVSPSSPFSACLTSPYSSRLARITEALDFSKVEHMLHAIAYIDSLESTPTSQAFKRKFNDSDVFKSAQVLMALGNGDLEPIEFSDLVVVQPPRKGI